jgi:phospholipase C
VNPSFSAEVDTLNGPGLCNTNNGFQQGKAVPAEPLNGNFGQPAWGRCGYGTRMPLLLVSPLAKRNYVDHTLTDQSSVLRFIEDNWLSGERIQPGGSFDTIAGPLDNMFNFDDRDDGGPRKLVLDEATGVVVSASKGDNGDRHYGATVLQRGGLQLAATPPTVCSKSRVLPEAAPRLSGMTC